MGGAALLNFILSNYLPDSQNLTQEQTGGVHPDARPGDVDQPARHRAGLAAVRTGSAGSRSSTPAARSARSASR
jgi:hypothetical protein